MLLMSSSRLFLGARNHLLQSPSVGAVLVGTVSHWEHASCLYPIGHSARRLRSVYQRCRKPRKEQGSSRVKQNVVKQANLEKCLEQFINIGTGGSYIFQSCYDMALLTCSLDCAHAFLRTTFQPHTGLTIQTSLTDEVPASSDEHLGGSPYEMTWTVLDQNQQPPPERCCHICNPDLLSQSNASD